MAGNYTLENEVSLLHDRAHGLWEEIENNTPDLAFIGEELNYISARASELASAAFDMDGTLTSLGSPQPAAKR